MAVQLGNSVGIVIGRVVVCLAVGSLSWYALTKLSPPRWVRLVALALAGVIPLIPPTTLAPGLYVLLTSVGLLGTVSGPVIVYGLFNLPFAVLLMSL
ncbi:hypothetical protein [Sinomonas gamaensis]|uniref:hypothetical protein n=1 Tax=Sinomonas gamaensis TaxID=2565624 RepID=UPI001108BB0F|nr:hypothetical protein [Sinomonas gamaensis]